MSKRRKIDVDDVIVKSVDNSIMDNNTTTLKNEQPIFKRGSTYTLYPILSNDLTNPTPLIEVYTDNIVNPRDISKVVIFLNTILPLPELSHLKRIKGRSVLLGPKYMCERTKVHELLQTKKFDTSLLENNVQEVLVAKISPKVRMQYDRVQSLWPCNFHSNKYLDKLATNTLFDQNDLDRHIRYMKMAVNVTNFSHVPVGSNKIGVIVVDPKINSVVAVGYNGTSENPIKHACMVAMDNVAITQNGGAWSKRASVITNSLNLSGIPEEVLKCLCGKYTNVNFGAALFKRKSELDKPEDGPYLCTGYYVYVTHEPCIMCSMALIHSRVNRVFYGVKTANGGLGSKCKIHTVKDLNHHYEVFAGLLEEEIIKL